MTVRNPIPACLSHLNQLTSARDAKLDDLKTSVIAFGAPAMVAWAKLFGLPDKHLYPAHYDILKNAGGRMDDFIRTELDNDGRLKNAE